MSTAKAEGEGLAVVEIFTAGAALFLVTVILVILLQIIFYVVSDQEEDRKRVTSDEFSLLKSEQLASLQSGPRWINEEKGTVGMSLDQAFDAVIRTYGEGAEAR
jgi:hypothetical protein